MRLYVKSGVRVRAGILGAVFVLIALVLGTYANASMLAFAFALLSLCGASACALVVLAPPSPRPVPPEAAVSAFAAFEDRAAEEQAIRAQVTIFELSEPGARADVDWDGEVLNRSSAASPPRSKAGRRQS